LDAERFGVDGERDVQKSRLSDATSSMSLAIRRDRVARMSQVSAMIVAPDRNVVDI